jgi:O-antigen/teichoic acid export membrane protein
LATSSNGPTAEGPAKGVRGAIDRVLPRDRFGDQRDILGGAAQNVLGLVLGATAAFGAQVLITRRLGPAAFGIVTLATQVAFVGAAATRFGMDAACVRLVAILVGRGQPRRSVALVARAVAIATLVSVVAGAILFLVAEPVARAITSLPEAARPAFQAAALALPFAAVAQTYLGATRGLKIMRHTLYIFWVGQWVAWIVLCLAVWVVAESAGATVLAYAGSWALATVAAYLAWGRETRKFPAGLGAGEGIPEERTGALLRFGALRAPATLFAQLLFWTDLFVLARFAPSEDVGIYGAAVRAAQSLLLFLTSLSLMFSPFVADLHARGEREHLDRLYKSVTRWTLAATLPILLVLAILSGPILQIFGGMFDEGQTALRILIVGMIVPVCVGTVGFILIMVGRTGWDLLVYAGSFAIDIGIAIALARPEVLGIEGAAIAQAVTLTLSALARLYLVRRFVGIWPFDRHFLRLAIPTAAGAAVMLGVHAALSDSAWPVDLAVSGGAGVVAYAAVLLAVGLKPAERRSALALIKGAVSRRS